MEPALTRLLIVSAVLRLGLLLYGEWQDRTMQVKFTDIDYSVFTDAAKFVYDGQSPYMRSTYRYTPVLAWLMLPNVFVPAFGKLLFGAADLACGAMIHELLAMRGIVGRKALFYTAFWLLNPMVFTISMRGNAESLVSLLVLGTLLALSKRHLDLASILFGAAVHLKTYPIIYAFPIFFFLDDTYYAAKDPDAPVKWNSAPQRPRGPLQRLFHPLRMRFAITSALSFVTLFVICLYAYGDTFVEESILYHLIRRDHRHNFSPYWYYVYLTFNDPSSLETALAAFLPQLFLLCWIGYAYHRDLYFCLFLETFVFVTFNKVCTSQYFVWFICFLPLVLPFSKLVSTSRFTLVGMVILWAGAQAAWLYNAYKLEILGLQAFAQTWAASVGFFVANILIAGRFIANHIPAEDTTETVVTKPKFVKKEPKAEKPAQETSKEEKVKTPAKVVVSAKAATPKSTPVKTPAGKVKAK